MHFGEFAAAALAAAALALPGAAGAVTFSGGYTVSAHGADPGLVVGVNPGAGGFATDLEVGGSYSFDLFRIWTDESSVNDGEDTVPKLIEVAFAFDAPGAFGDTATGTTVGERRGLFGLVQNGRLAWDGPLVLPFGKDGSGQVTLKLSDAAFNWPLSGWTAGEKHGADVTATLTYDVAPVPLPATLPLLLGGIGIAGAVARRRRAQAAA